MPGLTSPIADCLSAGDDTFVAFWDPVVEAMMVSVMKLIEPICMSLNPPDLSAAIDLAAALPDFFIDIVLDPLILFELGGIELPNILLNLDLGGIAIDLKLSINAAIQIVINMLLIPINIVLDMVLDFPSITVPTVEIIIELLIDVGFDPNIDLGCVADIIMIPMDAIAAALVGDTAVCPSDEDEEEAEAE